jgi:hypothetical protein
MHVRSARTVNNVSSPSSLGMEPVRRLRSVRTEWQGNVSKRGIHTNKTHQSTYWDTLQSTTSVVWVRSEWNPRVDYNLMNRMARKCEQAWYSCQQDKPIHVRSPREVNDVNFPSSLGMEPVMSGLPADRIEWQANVIEQNGKELWARSVKFMPTRHTNARTERQRNQLRKFSEFAGNGTRELIKLWWNRGARQAWHSYDGIEWQGKVWVSVTVIWIRITNLRTENQPSQRGEFSEFARNGTR